MILQNVAPKIFNAMLVLGDRGEPVDLVTVTSELANTDLWKRLAAFLI